MLRRWLAAACNLEAEFLSVEFRYYGTDQSEVCVDWKSDSRFKYVSFIGAKANNLIMVT